MRDYEKAGDIQTSTAIRTASRNNNDNNKAGTTTATADEMFVQQVY